MLLRYRLLHIVLVIMVTIAHCVITALIQPHVDILVCPVGLGSWPYLRDRCRSGVLSSIGLRVSRGTGVIGCSTRTGDEHRTMKFAETAELVLSTMLSILRGIAGWVYLAATPRDAPDHIYIVPSPVEGV
ncbi:hypothetical protein L226DRAFT_86988 [Lentinus tigrinus ALCF2SS1-7]|uniref:uncharacterized protein n=1 Tax=Lentinus tigrinus ALCF2SS1-7 TaxID=1328758 RepID=UPI00116600E2|nr:hypothetical protein L226DRAFT_86988 [Lentinus tigrinus ALCF2SS1-7]